MQSPEGDGYESNQEPSNDSPMTDLSAGSIFLVIDDLCRLLIEDYIFISGDFLSHRGRSVAQSSTDFKHYSLANAEKIC